MRTSTSAGKVSYITSVVDFFICIYFDCLLGPDAQSGSTAQISYAALQPWTPLASLAEDVPWTIIALRPEDSREGQEVGLENSTIQFPAGSPALGTFLKSVESLDPSRSLGQIQKPIEIRVRPVEPLFLDTIFVTVQKNLLQTIDEVQSRFGGGFPGTTSNTSRRREPGRSGSQVNINGSTQRDVGTIESRLQDAVREGLSKPKIVHSGDLVTLPLPSHPITYAPPPPAIVMACEPVNQGLLSSKTKIVLIEAQSSHERALKKLQPPRPVMKQVAEDDAEDTSNEQFFSAAEDRYSEAPSEVDGTTEDDSAMNDSGDHSDDDSDDSLDDMISLSAPGLPPQPSGTLSAMTTATPRPGGRRATGNQTPGSVYSNYTSTTSRPGKALGKTLKAEVLLQRIPQEALFPRPGDDEDDESFVFVDINMLAKVGCFSGDWVKIEIADSPSDYFSSLNFGNTNGTHGEQSEWRAARLFGVPGLSSSRPRYAVNKSTDRRTSFSQMTSLVSAASVYMPPIMFNNLGESRHVKLSPLLSTTSRLPKHLANEVKTASGKSPPIASEIVLTKIQTPSATERSLDHAVFSRLQKHFEQRRRLLKSGDLVGLYVDETLARAMFSPAKSTESTGDTDISNTLNQFSGDQTVSTAVVWFSVSHVSIDRGDQHDEDLEDNPWGGVALVDVNSTTIRQAGTETRNIPSTTISNWQYWHGTKKIPLSSSNMKSTPLLVAEAPKYHIPPLQSRLRNLVGAATSARAMNMGLPPLVILLHSTQRLTGKTYLATQACAAAGIHTFPISSYDVLAEGSSTNGGGDVKTEGYLTARAERAFQCGAQYTALLVQHIEQFTADRMLPTLKDIIASSRVLIATTTDIEKIPDGIRGLFTHELEVKAPDESEREGILHNAVLESSLRLSPAVSLRSVALKTAALVAGDLIDVIYRASLARSHRILDLIDTQNAQKPSSNSVDLFSILLSGGPFATHILPSDFDSAVTTARAAFSASISAPRIPSVTWSDVGGLASAKSSIMETISLPLTHPSLFAKGLRKRSGILFYGPPGTGKTLLAKAIATEFSLNFFSVKGPELLNMYIGESEANVRRVFQRARDARPCVVFFDELDSVAPKRGNQGDSGGVMDRIVSQLLAELDGMSSGSSADSEGAEGKDSGSSGGGAGVFVIGATNRPDLLDPALLRPGRFDKLIYLGIPDTHEKQLHILQALTRKFALDPSVNLDRVADRLPLTYTGADLYALASDAMLKAVTRRAGETDVKVSELNEQRKARGMDEISTAWYFDHVATSNDTTVLVDESDFDNAARELVGSVSEKELQHFQRIRQNFEQGDTPPQTVPSESLRSMLSTRPSLPLRPSGAASPASSRAPSHAQEGVQTQRPRPTSKSSSTSKGKGKNVIANPDSEPDVSPDNKTNHHSQDPRPPLPAKVNGTSAQVHEHEDDEDDDEFVINTSQLLGKKGKGKHTAVGGNDEDGEENGGGEEGGGFMSFDEKDEDLYR